MSTGMTVSDKKKKETKNKKTFVFWKILETHLKEFKCTPCMCLENEHKGG